MFDCKKLRKLRENYLGDNNVKGLTQTELAQKIGVSKYTIQRIESGHPPSWGTIEEIAVFFRVPLCEFSQNENQKCKYFTKTEIKFIRMVRKNELHDLMETVLKSKSKDSEETSRVRDSVVRKLYTMPDNIIRKFYELLNEVHNNAISL